MTLLFQLKRLHDVVRTNGCGVTTAGFSGDDTPLVVYTSMYHFSFRLALARGLLWMGEVHVELVDQWTVVCAGVVARSCGAVG